MKFKIKNLNVKKTSRFKFLFKEFIEETISSVQSNALIKALLIN